MSHRFSFLCCFLFALSFAALRAGAADQPWLMSFPLITHDDLRICFSNKTWTAYYSLEAKTMYTIPTDSVTLPPQRTHTNSVAIGNELFSCRGNSIQRVRLPGLPEYFSLPELSGAAAAPIYQGWKEEPPKALAGISETIDPLGVNGTTLWFGLTAKDRRGLTGAGIGWFDPVARSFGRVYSPTLVDEEPIWIDVVRDTVIVVFERRSDKHQHLVSYAIESGEMSELSWQAANIPGERMIGIDRWKDFLLLATDQSIAIWAPGHVPNVWTTRAYAAKRPVRLKMLKFVNGEPDSTTLQDFLPMYENRPSEVMAQVGDLVEVVAHAGVEGFVSKESWDRYGTKWRNLDWECSPPCFARVRVPSRGEFIEGDLLNTPITFVENTPQGVKVGFAAGWTNIDYLTPALIPYP